MKGFISILKGRKFRTGKVINSSFLLKTPKEEKENIIMKTDYYPKLMNNIQSKKVKLSSTKLNYIKPKKSKINENYEDLFFYFLKNSEKIENFETSEENKKKSKENIFQIKTNENKSKVIYDEEQYSDDEEKQKKRINIKQIYYHEIYLNFIQNKIQWKNFLFPKGIYNLMYQKSRIKQKEIFKFCIQKNYNYNNVIKSYDKIYTNITLKHNWELSPHIAYMNYVKTNKKKNLSQSKELNRKNLSLYNLDLSDVVIKANNKGEGRTLMYIGKVFNIYVEDYLKKNKNIISINLIEPKLRKEIVYNDTDLLKSLKIKQKMDFSCNNNSYNNLLKSNKMNILNKKIKQNYNLHLIINDLNLNTKPKLLSTSSSDTKNIINYKRCNTELKELNNSSKSNIKNNQNIPFYSKFNFNESYKNIIRNFSADKKTKKDFNNIIENNKNGINKQQINIKSPSPKKVTFSPSSFKLYKPIIKIDNCNNLNNHISNNINKPIFSKINLNNNEKQEIENNKSNNSILYYFKKSNSEFYYL